MIAPAHGSTWVNGVASEQISSADRGLHYGDGLFETISCVDGRPRWLARHLRRLRDGCERLGLRFDDFEGLGAEISEHAAGHGRCIIKLILTRGDARRRGYAPTGDEIPSRIIARHEWPEAAAAAASGIRVGVSAVRLGLNPQLAGLKHLNRLEQVLAQMAMRDAALEEVLMLSSAGEIIGGSMSNVFFVTGAQLFTPSLHDCGVAGIMRQLVCAAAERCGMRVQIRRVDPAELPAVREAFLTNVRWGVQPIAVLEGRSLSDRHCAQAIRRAIDASQP